MVANRLDESVMGQPNPRDSESIDVILRIQRQQNEHFVELLGVVMLMQQQITHVLDELKKLTA